MVIPRLVKRYPERPTVPLVPVDQDVRIPGRKTERMRLIGPRRPCGGRYRQGDEVYLLESTAAPLSILATAVAVSGDVTRVTIAHLVQPRSAESGTAFWATEEALTNLTVGVIVARDASDSVAADGQLTAGAIGGRSPFAYRLLRGDTVVRDSQLGDIVEFEGLSRGEYAVEATDSWGLRASRKVTIYDTECRTRSVDMGEGVMCVTCCKAPRSALLIPCRHMGLCLPCARTVMRTSRRPDAPNGICPFCRGPVCGVIDAIWT